MRPINETPNKQYDHDWKGESKISQNRTSQDHQKNQVRVSFFLAWVWRIWHPVYTEGKGNQMAHYIYIETPEDNRVMELSDMAEMVDMFGEDAAKKLNAGEVVFESGYMAVDMTIAAQKAVMEELEG